MTAAKGLAAAKSRPTLFWEITFSRRLDLNASGMLARYRILHFAAPGLLAGDVADIAKKQGEPALVRKRCREAL